jgi:formyl-CoA transferase
VRTDKLWAPLCEAMGLDSLISDPRFATEPERRSRSTELAAILSGTFAKKPYEHWRQALAAKEVTFGVISRPQDVPNDDQAVACGAIIETAIPEMPRTLSNPIRLGFAEQRIANPAPALGQHSEEILREAGLSAAEIAALKDSGAVT